MCPHFVPRTRFNVCLFFWVLKMFIYFFLATEIKNVSCMFSFCTGTRSRSISNSYGARIRIGKENCRDATAPRSEFLGWLWCRAPGPRAFVADTWHRHWQRKQCHIRWRRRWCGIWGRCGERVDKDWKWSKDLRVFMRCTCRAALISPLGVFFVLRARLSFQHWVHAFKFQVRRSKNINRQKT